MASYILIRKGAILHNVELNGINIVFDLEEMPASGDDNKDMIECFQKVGAEISGLIVTNCNRATSKMLSEAVAALTIAKASGKPFINPHPPT